MHKYFSIFLLFLLFVSCKNKSKLNVDLSDVKVNFKVNRFDVDFYNSPESSLNDIKQKYPRLFPTNVHDSVWFNKRINKDEQELFIEVQKIYSNIDELKDQLTSLFKHIKYYNPKFHSPTVTTVLSNVDYDYKVIYTPKDLLISLDVYLGANHPFYVDFPNYIKQNYHKNHIVVDVANAIIDKQIPPNSERTFINKMIYEGKKMYLLDAYLPIVSDQEKIGYLNEKINWTEVNESQVWKYFIEKDLLYSTNTKLNKRFLESAPFSKFYMATDNSSPGRIGVWIGWQIVRSYMQNNDVSLQQLLQTNAEEIFKKSKYKPKK